MLYYTNDFLTLHINGLQLFHPLSYNVLLNMLF